MAIKGLLYVTVATNEFSQTFPCVLPFWSKSESGPLSLCMYGLCLILVGQKLA